MFLGMLSRIYSNRTSAASSLQEENGVPMHIDPHPTFGSKDVN